MENAKWYVIHTYSGYENKVKTNIEKTVENRELQDKILEVRLPEEDVVEVKDGVSKESRRKLCPGYLFGCNFFISSISNHYICDFFSKPRHNSLEAALLT